MKTAIRAVAAIAACLLIGVPATPVKSTEPVFGTTVVIPYGLRGELYLLPPATAKLPGFSALDPVGVLYASKLDIPRRSFTDGFPGVTNRIEWFALDYSGRFWIAAPGDYRFAVTSDDGAKLYIDGQLVINNDFIHAPERKEGNTRLTGGIHHIRLSYFQGPRFEIALQLEVRPPDGRFRIFSTEDFKPPYSSEDWKYADANELAPVALPEHSVPHRAEAAFMTGAAAFAALDFRRAEHSLRRAIQIDPEFVRAWSMLGLLYYERAATEQARTAWQKALAINPADIKAAVHLASLELEEAHDREALRITRAAIQSGATDNPLIYYCDAVANGRLGNIDAAIESARSVARLDMAGEAPRAQELLRALLAEKAQR